MSLSTTQLLYLIPAVLFILGLKMLSHPRTAVRGNQIAALAMLIAIVVTLLDNRIVSFEIVIAGLLSGALVGVVGTYRVPVTAMPQLVAVLNGFGGGASGIAVGAALHEEFINSHYGLAVDFTVPAIFSGIIGGVTLLGSAIAFAKLQGLISERPILLPLRHVISALLFSTCIAFGVWFLIEPETAWLYWAMMGTACVLGIFLVLPIGGADMPVVISVLNSYAGLGAASHGFVVQNTVLITAGTLVGAAGFILTTLMCRAMNRSLANVLFGGVGVVVGDAAADEDVYAGKVKSTTAEEVAIMLEDARRVVIVPGYGMATAQAQFAVQDLVAKLEDKGAVVEFGIHAVAGRMPGHMNVLLAEANVPYEKLKEMDEVNPLFRQTDVVLVIGANDVVNPMARDSDPSIPISGMPILDVDQATVVVVVKRSLSPGFAGIPNPLFAADNTLMLFADARQACTTLAAEVGRS